MKEQGSETGRITRLAERALSDLLAPLPRSLQAGFLERTAALMAEEIERERARCVRVCRYRAELWQGTSYPVAAAREEARARGNEAAYLADLLELGQDFFPEADA